MVTQSLETISNLKTERKVLKISFNFGHIVKSVLFLCMVEFRHREGGGGGGGDTPRNFI